MEEWIYGFRKVSSRELTDSERQRLRGWLRGVQGARVAYGVASILSFILGFLGIALAAGGASWGWAIFAICSVGGLFLLAYGSGEEGSIRLARRALRIGRVDRFEAASLSWRVRMAYEAGGVRDEHDEGVHRTYLWRMEEEFREDLSKSFGKEVTEFESLPEDGVVLFVDGRLGKKVVDGYVVRLATEPEA